MPNALNDVVILTRGGINGKTTGNTVIDTTENGTRRFVPLLLIIEATTATAATVAPTVNFGTVSANYNDVISAWTPGVLTTNNADSNGPISPFHSVAANTDLVLRITTGATATTYTLRADVVGYYV